jgi:signal transduction histidine kinase
MTATRRVATPNGRILAVTEEELRRIILDVHDGAAQQLFAALAQVKLMQRKLAAGEPTSDAEWLVFLGRLEGLLASAQNEVRNFLGTFRPPDFPHRDLIDILRGLILQHENFTGCQVDFLTSEDAVVASLAVKIALYRICQEALANAFRHAGVTRQTVRLSCTEHRIRLEVSDQGRGFSPPPLYGPEGTERGEHIGLRGMRDRVALVDGELTLRTAPGKGTTIVVTVPAGE